MSTTRLIPPNVNAIRTIIGRGVVGIYAIEKNPGLKLAIRGQGQASWRIRYRVGRNSQQRWFTLHNAAKGPEFGEVAVRARQLLTDVKVHGIDPHTERDKATAQVVADTRTLKTVYDEWLKNPGRKRTLRPESIENYNNQFKHIAPLLGSVPIAQLTKAQVAKAVEAIRLSTTNRELGWRGYMATKALKLVRSVCIYALDKEYISSDPTRGIGLPVPEENPDGKKNRPPTDDELKRLWQAAPKHMSPQHVHLMQLGLLLGKRVSEMCGARWTEINLEGRAPCWFIPGTRKGNKSRQDQVVPLPRAAVVILRAQREVAGSSELVVPARGMPDTPTSRHSPSQAFSAMRDTLGIDTAIRFHDARGLISDQMAKLRVPSEYRSHVLHHTGDTKASLANSVYSAYDFEVEKRRALRLWALRLQGIVGGCKRRELRW